MPRNLDLLVDEIVRLQDELEREIETQRAGSDGAPKAGRVGFEPEAAARHRRLRLGMGRFLGGASFATVASAPLIYSLVAPIALLDAWASLYQAVCFRVYRIPRVCRSRYVVLGRDGLSYLNPIEALNCLFCGYANGVIGYVREIAGRTEQYWCPIKHARAAAGRHDRYRQFLDYGDAEGYRARLEEFRARLRAEAGPATDVPL